MRALLLPVAIGLASLWACNPDVPGRACGADDDCFTQERCVAGSCVASSLLLDATHVSREAGPQIDGGEDATPAGDGGLVPDAGRSDGTTPLADAAGPEADMAKRVDAVVGDAAPEPSDMADPVDAAAPPDGAVDGGADGAAEPDGASADMGAPSADASPDGVIPAQDAADAAPALDGGQ